MERLRAACATSEIQVGDLPAAAGRRLEAPLRASVLLVRGQVPLGIVSCDVLGLMQDTAASIAAAIEARCGVPAANVLVTSTHTHHAPHPMPVYNSPRIEELCERVAAAAIAAACQAAECLADGGGTVELCFALGQEGTVGENSRWFMRDGQISWSGHDEAEMVRPSGPHDPDLPVIAFRKPSGGLVAVLFGHGTHNIGTLDPNPASVISPGFFGLAAQELERQHGAPFLFLPGAFGSSHRRQSHVDGAEATTRVVRAVNDALVRLRPAASTAVASGKWPYTCHYRQFDEAREAASVSRWCRRWFEERRAAGLEATYAAVRAQLAPLAGQPFTTCLQLVRLGEVVLVGIPGELFAALGLEIRQRSPYRHTFVVGLANDEIGYIADRQGYADGGYQTWFCNHSRLEPGEGERMVEAVLSLLDSF